MLSCSEGPDIQAGPGSTAKLCVSEGSRCNMAIFKTIQLSNDENCLLFHCPTELDCPLMKAQDGTNTYNIYKGQPISCFLLFDWMFVFVKNFPP